MNHAVNGFAHAVDDVAQLAVVHIDQAPPQHALEVDVQLVALVDMVVEHSGEQVVRRADGVEVAGEVQIDVFHRQTFGHSRRPAAPPLTPNTGPKEGSAQGDNRIFADMAQTRPDKPMVTVVLPSPAGVGLMAVTKIRRPCFCGQFERFGRIDFGFVMAVGFDIVNVQTQLGGNFANRTHGGRLGDSASVLKLMIFLYRNGEEKEGGVV